MADEKKKTNPQHISAVIPQVLEELAKKGLSGEPEAILPVDEREINRAHELMNQALDGKDLPTMAVLVAMQQIIDYYREEHGLVVIGIEKKGMQVH